jgi:hypothetical protein
MYSTRAKLAANDSRASGTVTIFQVIRRVPAMLIETSPYSPLFLLVKSLFREGCTRLGSPGIFG